MLQTIGFVNHFSEKERDRRWHKAREFMKNRGLDALVVVGTRSYQMLDSYLSGWGPGCTVIFPLQGEPVLLGVMPTTVLKWTPETPKEELPWIEDVRIGARGMMIVTALKEKGLEQGRIGVVGIGPLGTDWEGWIPYGTWDRVVKRMPDCNFEDVTTSFSELTFVKSEEELAQFRRVARALEEAAVAVVRTVRAGVTELDVYAAMARVLEENGARPPRSLLCTSGPDSISPGEPAWLLGVGAPRTLEPGDIFQAGCIFGAYGYIEAQGQQSVAILPVSPENAECARLARLSYEEGLRALRPGKTFAEVVAAMDAPLERAGAWNVYPNIHSLNPRTCVAPTTVRFERLPDAEYYQRFQLGTGRIRGGEVVLEPGMTFELEPNPCIGRHRVVVGGNAIVTENEAEELNEMGTRMRLAGEV